MMSIGTYRQWLCVGLLASCCQAFAADPPAPASQPSVKRDCADAKGATKKECEKVAAKMDAQAANPAPTTPADETQSSADYVHHSSPVMRTPAEVAQDKKAKAQVKRENAEPKATPTPPPAPK
jgi:hypothetical protein